MTASNEAARSVYEAWHDATKAQDANAIAALYTEDALFESASVLALWPAHGSGIVRGRLEIERFFAGVFELNKDVFAEWYRTGTYFTDGRWRWRPCRTAPALHASRPLQPPVDLGVRAGRYGLARPVMLTMD